MGTRFLAKLHVMVLAGCIWACGAGMAWAEGGADSGAAAQNLLNSLCPFLGITPTSCPKLPTATQGVLELAGLQTVSPDYVRGSFNLGFCSVAGSPLSAFGQPPSLPPCDTLALSARNPAVQSSEPLGVAGPARPTPLALTLNKQTQAVATAPGHPS